jgi:hypothetical protein
MTVFRKNNKNSGSPLEMYAGDAIFTGLPDL